MPRSLSLPNYGILITSYVDIIRDNLFSGELGHQYIIAFADDVRWMMQGVG